MQLIQLKALNFMKFHKVDLVFPEKGLFCIQGANESGKSTVGHLIYFALSGLGAKGESPESLINWEKSQLKIKLTFYHNGVKYQILRQVDRDGSNFSKLAKGKEILAQGNTAIRETLARELRYDPAELQRSFLVNHRIVQNLVHSPSAEHLDYMLGLEDLASLKTASEAEAKVFESSLDQELQAERRLRDELRSVGYDESEELALDKECAEIRLEESQLSGTIEVAQNEQQNLTHHQEQLEKICHHLPSKLDDGKIDAFQRSLPKVLQDLGGLAFKDEDRQRVLSKAVKGLQNLADFIQGRSLFFETYESQLNEWKEQIGLDEEGPSSNANSLCSQVKSLESTISDAKTTALSWGLVAGLTTLASVTSGLSIFMFWKVVDHFRGSSVEEWFVDGSGQALGALLQEMMAPGELMGLPADPRPWAVFGVFVFLSVLGLVMAVHYRSKASSQSQKKDDLSQKKAELQERYHQLLEVDVKDMPEVVKVVESCQEEALSESLAKLNGDHPEVMALNYDLNALLHQVRGDLEEIGNHLAVSLREQQNKCSALDEEFSTCRQKLEEVEKKCEDMKGRKEKHIDLSQQLEQLFEKIEGLKRDRFVKVRLAELLEGTSLSVRERLRRDLTMSYKELMPKITSDRYASIRFNEAFGIEVFSEDRGDFVPLHQLSSGTNDLFVLLYQIILLQGFMDARSHDQHFLFLDEPLLAVDAQRYQNLADLLPLMTRGLKQVFLCRPPQDAEGTMEIQTAIDSTELISDLSLPREDHGFD